MKMQMLYRTGRAIVAGALFAVTYSMSAVAQPVPSVIELAGFTTVWSAPGSTGVTELPGNIDFLDAIARTSAAAPPVSTTTLRYPIQALNNDTFVHACLRLGAMYRDDSPAARVVTRLRSVDLTFANSAPTTIMTIDSAAYAASPNFQARDATTNIWFNFSHNVYYVEVQLIKSTAVAQPAVRWVYLAAPLSSILCP